jgi:hypothetical protein
MLDQGEEILMSKIEKAILDILDIGRGTGSRDNRIAAAKLRIDRYRGEAQKSHEEAGDDEPETLAREDVDKLASRIDARLKHRAGSGDRDVEILDAVSDYVHDLSGSQPPAPGAA